MIQFGRKLVENKFKIAEKVHEIRVAELGNELKQRLSQVDDRELINIRTQLIGLLGEALIRGVSKDDNHNDLKEWAEDIGSFTYNLGISLNEVLKDTGYYRRFLSEALEHEVLNRKMSIKELLEVNRAVDQFFDYAVYCLSSTYVNMNEKDLEAIKMAFLELSAPIVPISDSIAILPLVGDVDSERARLMIGDVLDRAVKLKLKTLILDLSGVPEVDTMVATDLIKIIASLELIGVSVILTGVRPEIANTAISLDIDFGNVVIRANLKEALADLVFKI